METVRKNPKAETSANLRAVLKILSLDLNTKWWLANNENMKDATNASPEESVGRSPTVSTRNTVQKKYIPLLITPTAPYENSVLSTIMFLYIAGFAWI